MLSRSPEPSSVVVPAQSQCESGRAADSQPSAVPLSARKATMKRAAPASRGVRAGGGVDKRRRHAAGRSALGGGRAAIATCPCCKAEKDSKPWYESEVEGDVTFGCADCVALSDDLCDQGFKAFCAEYDDDESFRAEVEAARKVKFKREPRECDDGEVVERVRFGYRVEDDVHLYTKGQLRDALGENIDVDKLRVPAVSLPGKSGAMEKYYVVRPDDRGPKRCRIFVEVSEDSRQTRLDASELLSERHLQTTLAKVVRASREQPECKHLFGKLDTLDDLSEKAAAGTTKKTGKLKPGSAQVLRSFSGLPAASSGPELSDLETAELVRAPSAASLSAESPGKMTATTVPTTPLSLRAESRARGGSATSFATLASSSASAALRNAGDAASIATSITPSKDVGTEDVRTMTPHQKADYWYNRLFVLDAMQDRHDKRPVRQGTDLVTKNEHTSDPALKGKLDQLATRLGHIGIAERLSANGIAKATDKELDQALDLMQSLEIHLPGAVQLRLVTRRLQSIGKCPTGALEMFRVLAPWGADASSDSSSALFDPRRPALFAVDLPDEEKISVFIDWVVFGIVQAMLTRGETFAESAAEISKSLVSSCLAATAEQELSDELATAVFDCVSCFRGLQAILQRSATPEVMSESMLKAVQQLKMGTHKANAKSICARVANFISKDTEYSYERLKEFSRFEAGVIECREPFEQVYNALFTEGGPGAGTDARHQALMLAVSNLCAWDAKMRPGSTKLVSEGAKRQCIEHIQKCLGYLNNGQDCEVAPEALATMVQKAQTVWPLVDEFAVLKASLKKHMEAVSIEAARANLSKALGNVLDAIGMDHKRVPRLDETVAEECKAEVAKAVQYNLSSVPENAKELMTRIFKVLNSDNAWTAKEGKEQLHNLAAWVSGLWLDDSDTKNYYELILRTFDTGHDMVDQSSQVREKSRKHDFENSLLSDIGPLVSLKRAVQRTKFELAKGATLPPEVGTWRKLQAKIDEADELLGRLQESLLKVAADGLSQSLHALDLICYGGTENDTWYDPYDEAIEAKGDEKAAWEASLEKLLKVDLKQIDAAVRIVDDSRRSSESVLEVFGASDEQTQALFDQASKLKNRAEMTKVEGAILYISRNFSHNQVQLRNKLAVQKARAMVLEGDDDDARLMHPKIRAILRDGMRFQ